MGFLFHSRIRPHILEKKKSFLNGNWNLFHYISWKSDLRRISDNAFEREFERKKINAFHPHPLPLFHSSSTSSQEYSRRGVNEANFEWKNARKEFSLLACVWKNKETKFFDYVNFIFMSLSLFHFLFFPTPAWLSYNARICVGCIL